jgi:hypothetical protein
MMSTNKNKSPQPTEYSWIPNHPEYLERECMTSAAIRSSWLSFLNELWDCIYRTAPSADPRAGFQCIGDAIDSIGTTGEKYTNGIVKVEDLCLEFYSQAICSYFFRNEVYIGQEPLVPQPKGK